MPNSNSGKSAQSWINSVGLAIAVGIAYFLAARLSLFLRVRMHPAVPLARVVKFFVFRSLNVRTNSKHRHKRAHRLVSRRVA